MIRANYPVMDSSRIDAPGSPALETRREFIKKMLAAGCFACLAPGSPASLFAAQETGKKDIVYRYRTLPVSRLDDMKEDIERLIRRGRIGTNEVFRKYIDGRKYSLPEDFGDAKSIIVMAVLTPMMYADFHHGGKTHEVIVPPQYYDDGVTIDDLQGIIRDEIIGEDGYRVERARGLLLKNCAVRSGLARYGRNNISYVEGMGSFLTLYAFYTDYEFDEDNWTELRQMDRCGSCRICRDACPTGCIRSDEFVIDVDRCVTLYNEIEGEFPDWMTDDVHTALIGCMMCQLSCPLNEEVVGLTGRLEAVTEEETGKILDGAPDDELIASLRRKLKDPYPLTSKEQFPIITRNLRALLGQTGD